MSAPATDKRILLIDDDESLRELFMLAMSKDFNAAVADDGVTGLAKAAVFKPHLIVLDLMMPRLNGFEVLRRLQSEGLQGVPVIVITGYSDQANEGLVSKEPNVVAFCTKPLKFNELIEKIRSTLAA